MVLLFLASQIELRAEAVTETPPPTVAKPAAVEEPGQAELLKSYQQMKELKEQLRTAEQAIVNNRLEFEAAARAQTASVAEKLETFMSKLAAERERQESEARQIAAERERERMEFQRAAAQREREQAAANDTTRIVLWVAIAFGIVGLLTTLATTLLQWRGIKRMAEVAIQPRQLPATAPQVWVANGHGVPLGDGGVTQSNQRLLSVIDRMERRIFELEHTAGEPSPVSVPLAGPVAGSETIRNATVASDQTGRISALLGKGRALLNTNKAQEAVACYDEILAIDANHPEALVKKGSALERLNQDLEAIECYDRAIKADRNMALAYLSKGGVFNRLQRFDEAVECYEQALQVDKVGKTGGVVRVSTYTTWPTSGSATSA